ncbi:MAG: galactose mutarotase [Prevotellaceae bacterium]|jgi:aldose 1-epimerase|nr:galactose mutarotase [Prevotellaceae bacterium]
MKNLCFISFILCFAACVQVKPKKFELLDKSAFETSIDGKPVSLYTLNSGNGVTVQVTNFGARIVSVWTPDRNGQYADINIGYENIDKYLNNTGERYIGCVVGRYANRIAKGTFEIDGQTYNTPVNNNGQTLHGGLKGLDMVVWDVKKVSENQIDFQYVAKDGDDGFPGNLTIDMSYYLDSENGFRITYRAVTDKPTVVNLSNHAFFNLKGESNGSICDHLLTINASAFTPVDEFLIPVGEIRDVSGTAFDFRKPTPIGERIENDDQQLKLGGGYDHNWIIDRTDNQVIPVAKLYEPVSGRVMEVYSDQPGIQFYSGNFFDGKGIGKHGKPINYREALALETQKFPDSPNHLEFPSTRLNPGETYTQTCIYKFLTE